MFEQKQNQKQIKTKTSNPKYKAHLSYIYRAQNKHLSTRKVAQFSW